MFKAAFAIVATLILISTIGAGVYLTQQRTSLKSRASGGTNFTATAGCNGNSPIVNLRWDQFTPDHGDVSLNIGRYPYPGDGYDNSFPSLSRDTTSYTDSQVSVGGTYDYWVGIYNDSGTVAESNHAMVSVGSCSGGGGGSGDGSSAIGLATTCTNGVANTQFNAVGSQTYKAVFYNMRTNQEIGRTYTFSSSGNLRTATFNLPFNTQGVDLRNDDLLAVSIFLTTDNNEIDSTEFTCSGTPPGGGTAPASAYCRVTATPTSGSRSISVNFGGSGPTNSLVRLWLKKINNTAMSSAPSPFIRDYTSNNSHEYEIFNLLVTNPATSAVCNGNSCSTTLNVEVPDDGSYQAFCDINPPNGQAGCSGNPFCSYNGGQTNCVSAAFPATCTASGGASSLTSAFTVTGPVAPPPPGISCTDGIKNGSESAVDCGGSCTNKCVVGNTCNVAADCATNTCTAGVCATPVGGDSGKPAVPSNVGVTNLACAANGSWAGVLSWSGGPSTDPQLTGYRVDLSTDSTFNSAVYRKTVTTNSTTIDSGFLLNGVSAFTPTAGTYHVRVYNGTYDGTAQYSPAASLTIPTCSGGTNCRRSNVACQLTGSITGTQYCEGILGSDGTTCNFTQCWYDETKKANQINTCRIAASAFSLSCAPQPAAINLNAATNWTANITDSDNLGPTVNWLRANADDAIPANSTGRQLTNIAYSKPGNYTPQTYLTFPPNGGGTPTVTSPGFQSAYVTCTPGLQVGAAGAASSITATISNGSSTAITGQKLTFNASAADPNANVNAMKVFITKTLNEAGVAADTTADDCNDPNATFDAAEKRCTIATWSGAPDKTINLLDPATWTPKNAGTYIVYIEAGNDQGSTCSGRRDRSTNPCKGVSSSRIVVNSAEKISFYRLTEDPSLFTLCPIDRYVDQRSTYRNSNGVSVACPDEIPYDGSTIINHRFAATRPGVKTLFVQFISNVKVNGRTKVYPAGAPASASINLILPDPKISQNVSCNLDLSGKGVNVEVNGRYLGSKPGTIKLTNSDGESTLRVLSWTSDSSGRSKITANLANPDFTPDSGQDFTVNIIRAEDTQTTSSTCKIGVSQLSVGAKFYCRAPISVDQDNVDISIVEARSDGKSVKPIKLKAKIDKAGVISGLDSKLFQEDHCYRMSIKAPKSVRKVVEFQAQPGTTVIPDFRLGIGDIYPSGGDGKINSPDRSSLIREWNASSLSVNNLNTSTASGRTTTNPTTTPRTREGDFNQDGIVNSFDLSCMMFDFNAQDAPEVKAGPVSNPDIKDSCDAAYAIVEDTTSNGTITGPSGSGTGNTTTP